MGFSVENSCLVKPKSITLAFQREMSEANFSDLMILSFQFERSLVHTLCIVISRSIKLKGVVLAFQR
jgi:hypothetical protein